MRKVNYITKDLVDTMLFILVDENILYTRKYEYLEMVVYLRKIINRIKNRKYGRNSL